MPAVTVGDSTSKEIIPNNIFRTLVLIRNTSASSNLHLNFSADADTDNYYLAPGESYTEGPERTGKYSINGISSSGNIEVKYSIVNQGT